MKSFLRTAVALLPLLLTLPAAAQSSFPDHGRPISIIVPYPPGGGSDVTARALQPELERTLGTSVVIVNLAGAGSQIGMTRLAQSRPDGYTIAYALWPSIFTLYLDPSRRAPFNRDSFVPLALHLIDPGAILVPTNSPFQSVADLVAAARARPDSVTMADPGILGWEHISSIRLQQAFGISLNQIHFQGAGPSVTALIAGQIDATMVSSATALAQTRSGTARALAVLAPERSSFLPDVPTMASLGTPLNAGSARGFVAPAGTPEPVVRRLAAALEAAITSEAHREQMRRIGLEVTFMGPADLSAYWAREEASMRPIVEEIARQGQNN
ncbi:MAG TPA: tripartite tricarboxylate transporter substrate binding protein [Roseomonas sp.]|jgi:tripartite-type tricarboxylate transporter receptor subunit TctC